MNPAYRIGSWRVFTTMALAVTLLCLIPLTASAQPSNQAAPWHLAIYDQPANAPAEVLIITSQGISQRLPVPATLAPAAKSNTTINEVALSADNRFLAASYYDTSGSGASAPPVAIADLSAGTCCVYVNSPESLTLAWDIGGFSPDNSQIALSYVGAASADSFPFLGGMMTVNAITGGITGQISMDQASALTGQSYGVWGLLGDWQADGVHFIPNCYGCDGVFEDAYWVWNPANNQISPSANEYFSIFGDPLALTHELLITASRSGYPMSNALGMLPPNNVIEYFAGGVSYDNGPVIFFNPSMLDLATARWVMDGNAILVSNNGGAQATVLYRNGAQLNVGITQDSNFLAGTPDGWLMTQGGSQGPGSVLNLIYYTVINGSVSATQLGSFTQVNYGPYQVAYRPPLGATATAGSFSTSAVSTSLACPGALPSRLTANGLGRVTPGAPNRIRSAPSTSGDVVGQIPGGAVFNVQTGPMCADGFAWWGVTYNNVGGFTAESGGGSYFVEPAQ